MLRAFALALGVAIAAAAADTPLAPAAGEGPAPGSNATAASAGGLFLTAWSDDRGVCAARVDLDGRLLDTHPIIVDPTARFAKVKAVGAGSEWTLFWSPFVSPPALLAARLALDGHLLDPAPRRLDGISSFDDVVRDGSRFAILSGTAQLAFVEDDLSTVRVARKLTPDAGTVTLAASDVGYLAAIGLTLTFLDRTGNVFGQTRLPFDANNVRVASIGDSYLAAWTKNSGELAVAAFTASGRRLAAPQTISTAIAFTFALVAHDDSYVLVASDLSGTLRGFRLAPDGSLLDSAVLLDASSAGRSVVALAWNGSADFLLTTSPSRVPLQGRIFGSFAAFRTAPAIPSIISAPYDQFAGAIAPSGNGFVAAWLEEARPEAIVRVLPAGGVPQELEQTSASAIDVASSGESALVVWNAAGAIHGRLLRGDGTQRALAAPSATVRELAVAWTGRVYLLLWIADDHALLGATVTASGELTPPRLLAADFSRGTGSKIEIACQQNGGCLAAGAWSDDASVLPVVDVEAVRFDADGTLLGAPAHKAVRTDALFPAFPFFDRDGHPFVLYGSQRFTLAAIVDGTFVPEITLQEPGADTLYFANDTGYLSRNTSGAGHLQWTWLGRRPITRPAAGVDLGPLNAAVLDVAMSDSRAILLVKKDRRLVLHEIPLPSLNRKSAATGD